MGYPKAAQQIHNETKGRLTEGVKTDDIVDYAKQTGRDGVIIKGVYDGSAYDPNIGYYDPVLTEHIFVNGSGLIKAPLGTSNWTMFNKIVPNMAYRYAAPSYSIYNMQNSKQ